MSPLYILNHDNLRALVAANNPGVYLLVDNPYGSVLYVGRSDNDLRGRLADWVGKYRCFSFGYCRSTSDAYLAECRLFHQYGGTSVLHNDIHPDTPFGLGLVCPNFCMI